MLDLESRFAALFFLFEGVKGVKENPSARWAPSLRRGKTGETGKTGEISEIKGMSQ